MQLLRQFALLIGVTLLWAKAEAKNSAEHHGASQIGSRKVPGIGILVAQEDELGKIVEAEWAEIDRKLPYPKEYRILVRRVQRNPVSVYETALDLVHNEGARVILSSLGSYDNQGILKASPLGLDVVLAPFSASANVNNGQTMVLGGLISSEDQGAALGRWAVGRFDRVLLLHAFEEAEEVDFALGFERAFQSASSKKSKFLRKPYARNSSSFEFVREDLKKLTPDAVVFPSVALDPARRFNDFLNAAAYSGAFIGTEGWLAEETLQVEKKSWIGRLVVSNFPGPFTGDAKKFPSLSLMKVATDVASKCMLKKVSADIVDCFRNVDLGFRSDGRGKLRHLQARPILWQLNQGGPRKIQEIE